MKRISITVFACFLFGSVAFAQVTIAPTNLFLDANSRFGSYMVVNGGNQTQEVSIDFFFAYSSTDNDGNRSAVVDDSLVQQQYSIADYIRAFPQNFTLSPGQRQMVRLRVTPPNDLNDGTYWARIKTKSSPEALPLELQTSEVVSATVGITVEQVTGLFYKKGDVSTGIEIEGIRSSLNDDGSLAVMVDYNRTGNSPFLGSVTLSLFNPAGEEVRRSFISTSMYFDGVYRQDFDLTDLAPGTYRVSALFESQRPDLSSNDLIQMDPVTASETISIR